MTTTETAPEPLLPCPFCGGEPRRGETERRGRYVECSSCHAATPSYHEHQRPKDPDAHWNKCARIYGPVAPESNPVAWAEKALEIWDNCHDPETEADRLVANRMLTAAVFAAQAAEDAPTKDAAPGCLLRAFLVALIDPASPDLDPYRAGNRKPAPEPGEELDRVARAICAEGCAFRGEPPCWKIAPDEWPNPECNEPGCMALARAALAERGAK